MRREGEGTLPVSVKENNNYDNNNNNDNNDTNNDNNINISHNSNHDNNSSIYDIIITKPCRSVSSCCFNFEVND